jgi:hypothetical protein
VPGPPQQRALLPHSAQGPTQRALLPPPMPAPGSGQGLLPRTDTRDSRDNRGR